jgi:hypothetical protein
MPRAPSPGQLRRGALLWGSRPAVSGGPAPSPTKPGMRLISFRPLVKGSLRGFATVELPIGLKIADVPVLVSGGRAWASLPSKPQIDKDGQHKRDINGKPAYTAILEWRDRALADRFSAAVVELVRAQYPDALEGAT